jgi:hypothetical protein
MRTRADEISSQRRSEGKIHPSGYVEFHPKEKLSMRSRADDDQHSAPFRKYDTAAQ